MATPSSPQRLTAESAAEDLAAYTRFVETSPQGILYCQPWWLEAVAPGQWEVLVVRKGNSIKAAWPMTVREKRGRTRIGMPPLTQKLGILFHPSQAKYAERLSEEHRLTGQLIDGLDDGVWVAQTFHENFTNWLPFYWSGFQQTTLYTYLLTDLTSCDRLWETMRTACRSTIRTALDASISTRETDDVELFYQVNQQSFQRQDMEFPVSLDLLARIDAACAGRSGRRMLLAEDPKGRIHACDYLVYDERCAVSILQGADPDLRKSGAQALLDWESIQFACTVSKKFDFEGSMIRGVEAYNRDFGAQQVPYFRIRGSAANAPIKKFSTSLRRRITQGLRSLANVIESS